MTGPARAARLGALGAAIGGVASLLALAGAATLAAVLVGLLRLGIPGERVVTLAPIGRWLPAILANATALVIAGAVAGALADVLHAEARSDARAWTTCLLAGLAWGQVLALTAEAGATPHGVMAFVVVASLAVGALAAVALWSPLVRAIHDAGSARGRGPARAARRIWAGGRRLASFVVGLLALVAGGPLLVVAVAVVVRAAMGQLPRDAWGGSAAACLGAMLSLGTSVLGLHWAGVPRRWPEQP